MKDDPVVAEVRKNRLELEKSLGNNPARIKEHFYKIRDDCKGRLYQGHPRRIRTAQAA